MSTMIKEDVIWAHTRGSLVNNGNKTFQASSVEETSMTTGANNVFLKDKKKKIVHIFCIL